MKKIIVPIDFSETSFCALKTGIDIANKLGADVRIVYVCPSSSFAAGFEQADGTQVKITDLLDKLIRENQQKYYVNKGKFDYKIREGKVPEEIVNQAHYDDATMIVMGSHGVSGITKSWIGGNAYRVICYAPCPVLVIRPDMTYNDNFQRIAIPVEITKSSRHKIPIVAGVAKLFNAKTIIIGIQSTGFSSIFTRITLSMKQVEKYLTSKAKVEVEKTLYIKGNDVKGRFIEALAATNADMVTLDVTNTGAFFADRFRPFLTAIVNSSHCPVLVIPIKE